MVTCTLCECHLRKPSSCSSSQHYSLPAPAGGTASSWTVSFWPPERGAGDGVIHDVSGYFLSCYLPESVSFPPHSLALVATGWGNVATGPCSFSNGEAGPCPLPSAEAGLAGAGFDGWKSTEPAGKACPSSHPP